MMVSLASAGFSTGVQDTFFQISEAYKRVGITTALYKNIYKARESVGVEEKAPFTIQNAPSNFGVTLSVLY